MSVGFLPEELFTNEEIYSALGLGYSGEIRVSTNPSGAVRRAAVFTSVPEARIASENPYHDRVKGDVLVYTAAGKKGDQSLAGPTARLIEQVDHGFPVYGFRRIGHRRDRHLGSRAWEFLGLLHYLRRYQDTQMDVRGDPRRVWVLEFRILRPAKGCTLENEREIARDLVASLPPDEVATADEGEVITPPGPTTNTPSAISPVEAEAIRRKLLALDSYAFEHVVREVLIADGYEHIEVTRPSQDGGIDLNAFAGEWQWPLRNLQIQIQAKRWLHTVGRKEVAELRGSLEPHAWGTLITTSHFSRAAMTEASQGGKRPIVLIEGLEFAGIVARTAVASRL